MSDQYKITQLSESGGFLRRIQINDGPWFMRVSEVSVVTRLTEERDELLKTLKRVKQWFDDDLDNRQAGLGLECRLVHNAVNKALTNLSREIK